MTAPMSLNKRLEHDASPAAVLVKKIRARLTSFLMSIVDGESDLISAIGISVTACMSTPKGRSVLSPGYFGGKIDLAIALLLASSLSSANAEVSMVSQSSSN